MVFSPRRGLLLLLGIAAPAWPYPLPQLDDQPLDCALRAAAHAYAQALQGGPQAGLFAALNLSAYCGATPPPALPAPPPPPPILLAGAPVFYLDALHGSDAAPGTPALPFASLPRGLAACRAARSLNCTLLLLDSAPFVLREALSLTPADSGLTLGAAPGAAPVLTGAAPVAAAWAPLDVDATTGHNIWRAQGPAGAPLPLALLAGGRRLPRARWPNAPTEDWETVRIPDGHANATAWHAPLPPRSPPVDVPYPAAARPWDAFFPSWGWGRGGAAEGSFFPPEGYWMAPRPAAGVTWAVPSGFSYSPQRWSPRASTWDTSAALVKVFHGAYWGSWAFEVAALDAAAGNLTFSRGGWQEARGWGTGGALYVENVREELDAPREWYAFGNGSVDLWWPAPAGTPPPPGAVSLAALQQLITIAGTPSAPASDISLQGLTFTGTQTTLMAPLWTAPSGGDWAFSDAAALRLEGTARVRVSDCAFTALGGNGVLLRGWNRGALLQRTSFSRLGESGVVSAGRAALGDLSALDVPAGTLLVNCSFSDLGVEVKQAGGLNSALSANTTVTGCVFHSLPRAAININDGAHGGHVIARNVIAATVLESQDQGGINSWDREPYVQTYNGTQRTPRITRIDQNFLLRGGWGLHDLDHDDGSNAFWDTRNVLLGTGMKNWEGFNRTWQDNLIIRPDFMAQHSPPVPAATPEGVPLPRFFYFPACVRSLGQAAWGALGDAYTGNQCILRSAAANIFGACNASDPALSGNVPRAWNNTYFTPGGAVDLRCGGNMTLARAQEVGWEVGSTQRNVEELAPADVVGMVRALLEF